MQKLYKAVYWILIFLFAKGTAFAQLQISAVSSTPSTCSNNGTITVSASTNAPPLLYSIISGPVTAPVQTGNVFNSMPAGTYTIRVSDGTLASLMQSVVVAGNYLQPDFNAIATPPFCQGASSGKIVGNRIPGTGNGPFTWELIAPSPVLAGPQASNTFTDLPAGNYSVRLTDGCSGFRTMVVTVTDPPATNPTFRIPPQVMMSGCDSARVRLLMYVDELRLPLTLTFTSNSGSFTVSRNTVDDYFDGYFSLVELLPGFTYNDFLSVTVTDSCGGTATSSTGFARPFYFCDRLTTSFEQCNQQAVMTFGLNNPGCYGPLDLITFAKPPLRYSVTDAVTNAVLDADTLEGFSYGDGYNVISDFAIRPLPPNRTYNISITDSCGRNVVQQFFIPNVVVPPPAIDGVTIYPDACIDSSSFAFIFVRDFKKQPKLVLLSGPSRLGSTKPGYSYESGYAYPDTIEVMGFGANTYRFDLTNLASGTYQYKVIDSCGSEVADQLTVLPNQVTDFGHEFSYKKGCLGLNAIHYNIHSANGSIDITNLGTGITVGKYYQTGDYTAYIRDSVTNLPSGTYAISFSYFAYITGTTINTPEVICKVIRDTVVIQGYQTPAIIANNYVRCQQNTYLELIADSTRGVVPYQYEIVSGPQVFGIQQSNLFTLSIPGTYTIRIYDVCGNASTAQITVDPISFPPITQLPFSCNSINLTYGPSAYFIYNWTAPGGTVFTGDTLHIDPVTPADTGIYIIQKITDINGCKDTVYSSYHLVLHNVNTQIASICAGNNITVGSHIYNTTGVYTDTLTNVSNCDSIVVLNLTVVPLKRDSVRASICTGQQYTFNNNSYSIAGFYSDTLTTSGCDSIATLVLTVNSIIRDSLYKSICAGQQFVFNNVSYSTAGIYSDTLTTSTCDSIATLVLTVDPLIRDSTFKTICAGQQFVFNNKPYSTAGIYSDTLTTAHCDSIATLVLTVDPLKRDSTFKRICAGQQFVFNNVPYSISGIYSDTLTTAHCDSIATLVLTVDPLKRDSTFKRICAGQQFIFNNIPYSTAGIYSDTLTTAHCDSIATLVLTVDPLKRDSTFKRICEGQQFIFNNINYSTAGIYSDTLTTATCDSIATLVLTLTPLKRETISRSICAGNAFNFNGQMLTIAGAYTDTLSTTGCDSIVVLNLSIEPYKRDTINQVICKGDLYNFNGTLISSAGTYRDTLSTSSCDSIILLRLSISNPQLQITAAPTTIPVGGNVQLNATSSLTYLWSGNGISFTSTVIKNPKATLNASAWIYLSVTTSPIGCPARDSIFITVIPRENPCRNSYIRVPSAFTPNGNGVNDVFKILGDKIALKSFRIFNRWGEQVFTTTNILTGWNGKYRGEILAGSYVYIIQYNDCEGRLKDMRGNILLLR